MKDSKELTMSRNEKSESSRRSFLTATVSAGLGVAIAGSSGACASLHGGKDDENRELAELEELASEATFREGDPTISMRTAELRQYVSVVEECGRPSDGSVRARKARRVLQLQRETLRTLNSWEDERFEVNARFTSIFACGCRSRIDTCCKF